MHCPKCKHETTEVRDSRLGRTDGSAIRRRRLCPACHYRFTTYETARDLRQEPLSELIQTFLERAKHVREEELLLIDLLLRRIDLERDDLRLLRDHLNPPMEAEHG